MFHKYFLFVIAGNKRALIDEAVWEDDENDSPLPYKSTMDPGTCTTELYRVMTH